MYSAKSKYYNIVYRRPEADHGNNKTVKTKLKISNYCFYNLLTHVNNKDCESCSTTKG